MDVDDDQNASGGDYMKGRVVEPQGSFIKVLDTYKNIAPIVDAISVDTDGIGQVLQLSPCRCCTMMA